MNARWQVRFRIGCESIIIALVVTVCARPVTAQTPIDSLAEGREAGRAAAEDVLTVPYILLGFVSGVPIGLQSAIYLGSQPGDARWTYPAIGGGIVVGSAITISLTSAPERSSTPTTSGSYALGCREGYEQRLRQRRRNALVASTLVGMAAGAVLYQFRGIGSR